MGLYEGLMGKFKEEAKELGEKRIPLFNIFISIN